MFGFAVPEEFLRALKPGGIWVQVEAGPDHLLELRCIIYPTLKADKDEEQAPPAGFSLEVTERIRCQISLDSQEQIADLLLMTPHLFRASAQGLEQARQLTSLDLQVDVRIKVLRRL